MTKKVAWSATSYGIFVAYRAASMSQCNDDVTRLITADLLEALAPLYERAAPKILEALSNVLVPDFHRKWGEIGSFTAPGVVYLSEPEWARLKVVVASAPESGATSAARRDVDRSIEAATLADYPAATPRE